LTNPKKRGIVIKNKKIAMIGPVRPSLSPRELPGAGRQQECGIRITLEQIAETAFGRE
jgi:hypothetical protein